MVGTDRRVVRHRNVSRVNDSSIAARPFDFAQGRRRSPLPILAAIFDLDYKLYSHVGR
jgi:hypothetical protein